MPDALLDCPVCEGAGLGTVEGFPLSRCRACLGTGWTSRTCLGTGALYSGHRWATYTGRIANTGEFLGECRGCSHRDCPNL
jgi:hypothetical protein